MTSSSSVGSTQVTLQFDLDRDINGACRDVQAAINAATTMLPLNMPSRPTYRRFNPADSPILILALMMSGGDLGIIGIIGIILLIGIVKKNAIMMIDFALEAERKQQLSPREAIFQACLLRFRPILMTTMAALLGALPLMLGTGVGSELRHPLGITMVGGLLLSQLLTLYTTPVIYLGMDNLARNLAGWLNLNPPEAIENDRSL